MATETVIDSRFKTCNPQYSHRFEWILEKFYKIKQSAVLCTPKFRTKDGSTWHVTYEKLMMASGYEQSVLCFYNSSVNKTNLSIQVRLCNQDGATLLSPTVEAYNKENTVSFSFHHMQNVGGNYRNLSLNNDNMVLVCEMSWNKDSLTTEGYNPGILKTPPKARLKTLSCDFRTMYENSIGSDVTLIVKGTNILSHKSVLLARSEVFAKMLVNDMKEKKSGIIEIDDIEPDVFKLLLQYLYSGECPDCDIETVQALYQAADKYSVLELKEMIVETLVPKISTENAVSLLALADLHDDRNLKNEVAAFIKFHLAEIPNMDDAWKIFDNGFSHAHCSELLKNLCFKRDEE